MPSRAKELFRKVLEGGTPFIQQMVADERPESEILDYKAGEHLQPKDIRPKWATALSAFGNTDGGVLIFGIDCRKKEIAGRLLDVPRGTDPHLDPPVLAQKLKDLLRDCTEHAIQGVRLETFPDPAGGGYVVCFVPSGNDKPYRSMADGVYYQRVQDGCIAISHSLLRTMFYPQRRANLRAAAHVRYPNHPATDPVDVHITVYNDGPASAEHVFLEADTDQLVDSTMPLHNWISDVYVGAAGGINHGSKGRIESFLAGQQHLHPGQKSRAFVIRWTRRPVVAGKAIDPIPGWDPVQEDVPHPRRDSQRPNHEGLRVCQRTVRRRRAGGAREGAHAQ